jgi:hypothetical protein
MIAAQLRDEPSLVSVQTLVITNFGPTIARNVSVTFDPPIPDPSPDRAAQSLTPYLKKRYAKPIPVLIPGAELDNVYFVGGEGQDARKNREPTPDQVTVQISYEGPDEAPYTEKFPLDVDLIRQRTYGTSSDSPEAQAKRAVEALKSIDKTLTRLRRELAPDAADRRKAEQIRLFGLRHRSTAEEPDAGGHAVTTEPFDQPGEDGTPAQAGN